MTMLWLSIGTLLLIALWFLSLPLRRARAIHDWQQRFEADDHAEAQNLAVYERRLSALKSARDRGEIDVARFEEGRHELDRNLLEDTEAHRRMPLRRPLSGRLMIPLVITAVMAASMIGYRWLGADGDLALHAAQQDVLNTPGASMKTLVGRLEEEAGTQPDNPKVWSLLFPLYQKIGQPGQAIDALERLIELEGRRVDLLAQLAQIKFFVAGRSLTDEVHALIDEILDKDPREPTALGILGVEAFDDGRYEQAINYWRRALAGFEDSASAEAIRKGIAVAEQRLEQSANEAGLVVD
ncbi:c-type cytochrome biogenesis protein CcmI [Halopseudomonas pelagia]|uniref:C-type cytochrome biogenesis protein CcmI n=2 Tax=Halopseudomonas pelagia TaxID=553151 RepID=A0AA91U2B2_9GAMM|nr:c-type cytochrome biogenesis protein CcmI [Halopseudomonas pelagia]PCC99178.1 c-type cytochrome biogenesis protein CcmI [Halopseudomonas pelagia]QFY57621.1 c-type cytochrome biogenesis protein CcmI [Halopseudomonas pelagia]